MIGRRHPTVLTFNLIRMPHRPTPNSAMRLAQKATGLLKGLKPKHSDNRRPNGGEKDKAKPVNADKKFQVEGLTWEEYSRYPRTRARARGLAVALGKKRRGNMGHPAIAIHEDAHDLEPQPRRAGKMSAQDDIQNVEDEVEDEYVSEGSDSEDEPDESVMDDMKKLEENFEGISQKYRLINRIGEGQTRLATQNESI